MNVVFFLKISLIFKMFYCLFIFVNKHSINKGAYISKSKQRYNAKPSAYYFYMRAKILSDFCICISVPLKRKISELLESKLILRASKKWRPIYTEAIWKYEHKTFQHYEHSEHFRIITYPPALLKLY